MMTDPTRPSRSNRNRTVTVKAFPDRSTGGAVQKPLIRAWTRAKYGFDPDMPGTRSIGVGLLRVTLAATGGAVTGGCGSRNIGFTSRTGSVAFTGGGACNFFKS